MTEIEEKIAEMRWKKLVARRGVEKRSLTICRKFIKNVTDDTPIEIIETKLSQLQTNHAEYRAIYGLMMEESDNLEEIQQDFEEFENTLGEVEEILISMICERRRQNSNRETTSTIGRGESIDEESSLNVLIQQQAQFLEKFSNMSTQSRVENLPKVRIPTFTGDWKDWKTFIDLFMCTFGDNENITAVQKFQNLKSCLSGEPLSLLNHLTVSEENYNEAIEKLKQRYEKPHLIANSYIEKFMNIPHITSTNLENFRNLYDVADATQRGLHALGPALESRDIWLVYILVQKLNHDARKDSAKFVQANNIENPTLQQFLTFIDNKCMELEVIKHTNLKVFDKSKPSSSGKQFEAKHVKNFYVAPEYKKDIVCIKCKKDHFLFKCDDFIKLDVNPRRQFVKANNLCFNYLRFNHTVYNCSSKSVCHKCSKKHHTLVHEEKQFQISPTMQNNLNGFRQE